MAVSGVTASAPKPATTKPADKPADTRAETASADKPEGARQAEDGAKAIGDAPKPASSDKPAPRSSESSDKPAPSSTSTTASHSTSHDGGSTSGSTSKTMNFGNDHIIAPARGDSRFADGSTGSIVKEGDAPTLKIADGPGFGGLEGRKQNAGDKEQNNYSVTDANFNNKLGILATDPDTGKPMTYVQHIQSYNAAGYIETYAPDVYRQLSINQNNGKGTVLGASLYIMGMTTTADPAVDGVDISKVPMTVPGTNLDARAEVMDPKDGTGQEWARPHHAQSHWNAFKNLIDAGVPVATAQEFAGDDAVSGAGRLNGINNQDGTSGFNAGELEVYKKAAAYQQQTGIPVLELMMHAHNMNSVDPSALTNPTINKQLGLDPSDRSTSAARIDAIYRGLLDGTVRNEKNNNDNNNDNDVATDDGGDDVTGGGAGEVTGAGTGAIQTVDDQDPVKALTDIATVGFADGITGVSATRLATLLQHLIVAMMGQTAQLTPEILEALRGMLASLAQSQDPQLQALAKLLTDFFARVDAAGGQVDDAAFRQLIAFTSGLATSSGTLDAEFQTLLGEEGPAIAEAALAGTFDPATALQQIPAGAGAVAAGGAALLGADPAATAAAPGGTGAAQAGAGAAPTTIAGGSPNVASAPAPAAPVTPVSAAPAAMTHSS